MRQYNKAGLDKNAWRQWLVQWEKADEALRTLKTKELKSYDSSRHRAILDGMLRWACDHARTRRTSGLVEQQRLFQQLRRQKCL